MNFQVSHRRRMLILSAAVVVSAWGIAGTILGLKAGRGGFVYSTSFIIEGVEPGGGAEEAGLRPGDRVISVEGIAVEQLPLYSRWPRSLARGVGESLRLEVERAGEPLPVDVVYGPTPRGIAHMRLGGLALVLAFLWSGVWALLSARTSHASALALIGLAAGLTPGGPSLGTWDGVASHVQFAAMLLWTVLLLRFFITFPTRKRVAGSRIAAWLTFGVWALFLPLLVLELIVHPRLYHAFGGPGSLLMLVYLILALAAAAHTALKTPARELWASGMGLILVGILAAVAPTIVAAVDWALLRGVDIPGSSYYPLLLVLVPISMALAVRKHAHHAGVASRWIR